ncbi:hypothetical protein Acr_00g0058900 [Actinidia rufa]|uniref:Uncharacterized protein n=1 Tax=Actinidia rufa TaxID=165716 RepID=A0A7J0DN02_9ERIC|nr:hypothetical protein Acr_00g0058900 [Actinidia rufa]
MCSSYHIVVVICSALIPTLESKKGVVKVGVGLELPSEMMFLLNWELKTRGVQGRCYDGHGRKFGPIVPVLDNICRELNDISSSSEPWKCETTFPAHYVYAWLREYFDMHFNLHSTLTPLMTKYAMRMAKQLDETDVRELFRRCGAVPRLAEWWKQGLG